MQSESTGHQLGLVHDGDRRTRCPRVAHDDDLGNEAAQRDSELVPRRATDCEHEGIDGVDRGRRARDEVAEDDARPVDRVDLVRRDHADAEPP